MEFSIQRTHFEYKSKIPENRTPTKMILIKCINLLFVASEQERLRSVSNWEGFQKKPRASIFVKIHSDAIKLRSWNFKKPVKNYTRIRRPQRWYLWLSGSTGDNSHKTVTSHHSKEQIVQTSKHNWKYLCQEIHTWTESAVSLNIHNHLWDCKDETNVS